MSDSGRRAPRARLEIVTAWIDAQVAPLGAVTMALADAAGHVVATDIAAPAALPPVDRAALDGIALRGAETVGASAYNPLVFAMEGPAAFLPPQRAILVAAGEALPAGADSVVPIDQVQLADGRCEIVEPVEPGQLVARAGAHAAVGSLLVRAGRRLDGYALGLLSAAGIARVATILRPRVRLLLVGRTPGDTRDADGPLVDGLIARDGGRRETVRTVARDRATLAAALAAPGADLILVVGATGPGADDIAAAALGDAGTVAHQGVAVRPCETACVGTVPPGTPVILLPGTPAACLWAYELFGGRAVRRLAGRPAALPFATRHLTAARKIVSAIGAVDIVPVVRTGEDAVEPIAGFAEAGLAAALRADGVVIVPEGSEGYARDTTVLVYLFET